MKNFCAKFEEPLYRDARVMVLTDRHIQRQRCVKTLLSCYMVSKYGFHSGCMSCGQLRHEPTGFRVFVHIDVYQISMGPMDLYSMF